MKLFSAISLLVLFFAQPSMALFEVRAGYGVLASKPDLTGYYSGASSNVPSAAPNAGLTLDAVFTIPLVGLGAGLRMENMNIKYDSDALSVQNQLTRNALIVNYRLINTLIYLGPIFTYGINHTNKIKMSSGGTDISDISSNKVSSYTLGLEAGASLLGLMVGAEAGTMMMNYKNAHDGITGITRDLDMSGNYLKVFVGFGI
ncbi:MAG: hypothetical protein RJB66_2536 [Pseudomonadota bacterium]|jgi:hypothetical protein